MSLINITHPDGQKYHIKGVEECRRWCNNRSLNREDPMGTIYMIIKPDQLNKTVIHVDYMMIGNFGEVAMIHEEQYADLFNKYRKGKIITAGRRIPNG